MLHEVGPRHLRRHFFSAHWPGGCVNVRFALGKDVSAKLRDLSLAAELSSPDDLGRWAAGCCVIATAGCVSALSKLLADCAVVENDGIVAWMPKEGKEALSKWISMRIWRMSNPAKRTGHDPESLSSIGLPDEERIPMNTATDVSILSQKLNDDDSPSFDYRAIASKKGKIYRVHLCLDGPKNFFSVQREQEDGSKATGTVSMSNSKDGKLRVLVRGESQANELDIEFDIEFDDAAKFLDEWVLNGARQITGMVEEVGQVPDLSPSPRAFEYSSNYLRSKNYDDDNEDHDDGIMRSVSISPAPPELKNLEGVVELDDAFVDSSDGEWFTVMEIDEGPDGPGFCLFSSCPNQNGLNLESDRYPHDGNSQVDVSLDELLSKFVIMSDVDEASKKHELFVTRTLRGNDCVSVVLSKGPKAMRFDILEPVAGQASKISGFKEDRVLFADGSEELYENLIDRLSYWNAPLPPTPAPKGQAEPKERPAPGVRVNALAKELGTSSKLVIDCAKENNIQARNASSILKPRQADRIRSKMTSSKPRQKGN